MLIFSMILTSVLPMYLVLFRVFLGDQTRTGIKDKSLANMRPIIEDTIKYSGYN